MPSAPRTVLAATPFGAGEERVVEFPHPRIIQGGMGIGISDWRLARAVSRAGQLGTVSGTGVWLTMARRLQLGDPDGHLRRALSHFPVPAITERILKRYFVPGGKPSNRPFRTIPMLTLPLGAALTELIVAANFAEVWLAREGHEGVVAVNYLEKIQLSHLPSLYGAMLAGVDYVLMGAGIPIQIAEALDKLAQHEPASYRLAVEGASSDDIFEAQFDPAVIGLPAPREPLKRPAFFPIISSNVLAQVLMKRSKGPVQGFIVEGPTAGGHNAPPRGKDTSPTGEPVYGEQDRVDLGKLKALGLPFWLAGAYAGPDALAHALEAGAQGIQVGTLFALCEESGLRPDLRRAAVERALAGTLEVHTSATASPSGYPFKEASLPGTLTDPAVFAARRPICDIGALRTLYRRPDGKLGYRCPAEPLDQYVKKGGAAEDTKGRKCICNALTGTIDIGQLRPEWGYSEPPLLTLGSDLGFLPNVTSGTPYHAEEAIAYLLRDHA